MCDSEKYSEYQDWYQEDEDCPADIGDFSPPPTVEEEAEQEDTTNLYKKDKSKNLNIIRRKL